MWFAEFGRTNYQPGPTNGGPSWLTFLGHSLIR